ncbi:MAG TPA: OmpA family protein, partial [Vicinamibacterales bacterium]|nr:OmpA family protein [Vicinamibacterales bacterium]
VAVTMTDTTRIRRLDGIRPVPVSSADLIPGLRVKVDGFYNNNTADTLAATRISFSREDFRIAAAIQAGVTPTDQRSLVNERNIQEHSQTLAQHGQQLTTQSGQISANEQKIAATTGALAATNARIANLDDYTPVKSITVYFKNNKADVSKSDKALLQEIAAQARSAQSYVISVQAFASAVGPDPVNQRLSMDRANAVTAILQQSGVPLTNVVVPAAMGITEQVAPNSTLYGQAQNRRAVVTLLQNKGLEAK